VTFDLFPLLVAAPVVGVGVGVLALLARRRRIRAATAWSRALGATAAAFGRRSPLLLGGVALLGGIALAGPRWGSAVRSTDARAINVAIIMDVSKSMLAQDVTPDRLTRASGLARRLVQDLDGDRLGLVAFASRGYLLSPLTLDQSALEVQLDALDTEMLSEGGSGIASALNTARDVLSAAKEGGDRAIVLFTDGESFEGEPALQAAGEDLKKDRISLVVVTVGDTKGTKIPEPGGGFHRDQNGLEVGTVRRDDLMRIVTTAADGVLLTPASPDQVGDARRVLDRLARAPATDRTAALLIPRAWIFALGAALLLLVQTFTRRSAALIGVMLAVGLGTASAQRPSAGSRLIRRGDSVKAAAAFAAEARRFGSDTAWYNAGTSALRAGRLPEAVAALQRATTSLDPDLRRRALYNLGTAMLQQARRDSTKRDTLLRAATSQLQSALLLDPTDKSAKFNYELARRLLPPPMPKPPPTSGGGKNPPPPQRAKSGMTQAEAEQVLSAMERSERNTRLGQNTQRSSGKSPLGPDW
jgi:Ca-activated chloride channel family protein